MEKNVLPAKVIKATSVQKCTLNPKWNEKFQLYMFLSGIFRSKTLIFDLFYRDVDDSKKDVFHLDIWDHDEEDSVVDAVKKLNEVTNLKGLGRFFKQVAQSARTNADESVDDFLGALDVDIETIPSTGIQQWYKLQGRSLKSQVKGSIHLKMWIGTREDRGIADEDDMLDVKQHVGLIKIFVDYEIRQLNSDMTKWNGQLSQPALTILHQHAVQGDLTEVHQAMWLVSYWLAYSRLYDGLPNSQKDYGFLYKILNNLTTLWVPTSLSKDEEDLLAESFSDFLTESYDQIVRHRELYNSAEKHQVLKRLEDMLKCLRLLHHSALFKKTMPFQKEFSAELPYLIKVDEQKIYFAEFVTKSAVGYYEKRKRVAYSNEKSHLSQGEHCENAFASLTQLITMLNAGCYRAFHNFHKVFERATALNYFYITYKQWDKSLTDALCSIMADAVNKQMAFFVLLMIGLFRLLLNQLSVLWYFSAINSKAPINSQSKLSELKETSSHADVCHCIIQILEFWNFLEFPLTEQRADYLVSLVETICKVVEFYADKMFDQSSLNTNSFKPCSSSENLSSSPVPPSISTDKIVDNICIALNNTGHVREVMISLPKSLRFNETLEKLQESKHEESYVKKVKDKLESLIEDCDKRVTADIDLSLNSLIERHKESVKKQVFHLAWSPNGCQLESAIKPLIKQLDAQLFDYHKWLLPHIFIRLLMVQFRSVLYEIKATTTENPGQDSGFHKRMLGGIALLVNYFHADGQGVSQNTIQEDKLYKELTILLQLNQVPTQSLIEKYYETLYAQQEDMKEFKYGLLNVRAYFNSQSSLLVLDIASAKNIIPLDSNGLSDPFVITEVVPVSLFPNSKTFKTRVINKTLNPVFDETFQL
uniref:Uncharacterized protein n=1 Tax=Romanomermis culicivorax TaxID=13658 RepID=A0A915JTW0_ROMCU